MFRWIQTAFSLKRIRWFHPYQPHRKEYGCQAAPAAPVRFRKLSLKGWRPQAAHYPACHRKEPFSFRPVSLKWTAQCVPDAVSALGFARIRPLYCGNPAPSFRTPCVRDVAPAPPPALPAPSPPDILQTDRLRRKFPVCWTHRRRFLLTG